jgi:hypothetical protein
MTTPLAIPDLPVGTEVRVKCDTGESVTGWVSEVEEYEIDRPVVLEDGARTGEYIPGTGILYRVRFSKTQPNSRFEDGRRPGEFYQAALLRAMGHDVEQWGMK